MPTTLTAIDALAEWATPMPDMGPAVYRLTEGPMEHKHMYHIVCPWSPDQRMLLMMRYDRTKPEADICVQDMAGGEVRAVGSTTHWNTHHGANQKWLGQSDRILYEARKENDELTIVTVQPDGSEQRTYTTSQFDQLLTCSPDGRYAYGGTPLKQLFPNDELAPRHDKGLMRLDLETGESELLLSIEDALALLPNADEAGKAHLFVKMMIPHPRTGRIMFNLTNTHWDRDGSEPRIRCLITVDPDGSNPAYLGNARHHPNWHPIENRVIANVGDFNDVTRFGLYHGDGSGLLEYVPAARGAGHPTFSPNGKWIFTDGKSYPDGRSYTIFCEPQTGREIIAATFHAISEGYPSFKAVDNRGPGESVSDALARASAEGSKTRQTHGHPSWSRDGSVVLFNADLGDGSQLYAIDVQRTLENA